MNALIIHLRFMQLFAHAVHNLCKGATFFEDHAFFGDAYESHEADYDDVVERTIGLFGPQTVDFKKIAMMAAHELEQADLSAQVFEQQLKHEQELCSMIDSLCKHKAANQGLVQLLGNIADKSQVRQYKIKQKLSK